MIKVLAHTESHRWFGCTLCAGPGPDSDVEYHLQQAARSVLSNTHCALAKQLFLQQLASLQRPDITGNIYKSMTFNFQSLFVALWDLHRARIGQRNGMIFSTAGVSECE